MHINKAAAQPCSSNLHSSNRILQDDINMLSLYMSGHTFYISKPLLKKIKPHINLEQFVVKREGLSCPLNYPQLKGGIALRWLGGIGPGYTAVLTQDELTNLLTDLAKNCSDAAQSFYSEMMWKAFYHADEKTKSY